MRLPHEWSFLPLSPGPRPCPSHFDQLVFPREHPFSLYSRRLFLSWSGIPPLSSKCVCRPLAPGEIFRRSPPTVDEACPSFGPTCPLVFLWLAMTAFPTQAGLSLLEETGFSFSSTSIPASKAFFPLQTTKRADPFFRKSCQRQSLFPPRRLSDLEETSKPLLPSPSWTPRSRDASPPQAGVDAVLFPLPRPNRVIFFSPLLMKDLQHHVERVMSFRWRLCGGVSFRRKPPHGGVSHLVLLPEKDGSFFFFGPRSTLHAPPLSRTKTARHYSSSPFDRQRRSFLTLLSPPSFFSQQTAFTPRETFFSRIDAPCVPPPTKRNPSSPSSFFLSGGGVEDFSCVRSSGFTPPPKCFLDTLSLFGTELVLAAPSHTSFFSFGTFLY